MPIRIFGRNKINHKQQVETKEPSKSCFKGKISKYFSRSRNYVSSEKNQIINTRQQKTYKVDIDNKSKNIKDNTYQNMEADIYQGFDDYMLSKGIDDNIHESTGNLDNKITDNQSESTDTKIDKNAKNNVVKTPTVKPKTAFGVAKSRLKKKSEQPNQQMFQSYTAMIKHKNTHEVKPKINLKN